MTPEGRILSTAEVTRLHWEGLVSIGKCYVEDGKVFRKVTNIDDGAVNSQYIGTEADCKLLGRYGPSFEKKRKKA